MRHYQPVWIKLKRDKVVRVTANKCLHPRIIKAVTKEKWMDTGYKIELEPKYALLSHEIVGSIITFRLEVKLDQSALTVSDI